MCAIDFLNFLNGKEEAMQISCQTCGGILVRTREAYLKGSEGRTECVLTRMCGWSMSEDTSLCGFPLDSWAPSPRKKLPLWARGR